MTKKIHTHYLVLALILFTTFLFRLPSLFEPFWYGDEGIFAAVARNLNFGGVLYSTAWDNKPPMIYLTYEAIFKYLGVSMFSLRLVTAIVVLATCATIYEIAQAVLGTKRALLAAFVFGLLTSLRVVEGNLALTEIFMILPISLAMLAALKRNFDSLSLFCAGVLFATASLYKQVGALEAAALGIYLFLISRSFGEFLKKGIALSAGFVIPYALTIAYFAQRHLVGEYIFAAYTYYRIYLGESPKYALLINILKFLPILAAIWYGLKKKTADKVESFHLFLLWMAFSFLGSYFSGRTYGHYMVQAAPSVSLLVASIAPDFSFKKERLIFAVTFFIPILFLTKLLFTDFLSGGPLNQVSYVKNFLEFSSGKKGVDDYNNYFDRNVNSIMGLSDFFATQNVKGTSAYIWGDYSWLYAISDLKNPTRYVTSFHVFGVPKGKEEVSSKLNANPPNFIIKPPSSIGYFSELEKLLARQYTLVAKIENSEVFRKVQ